MNCRNTITHVSLKQRLSYIDPVYKKKKNDLDSLTATNYINVISINNYNIMNSDCDIINKR